MHRNEELRNSSRLTRAFDILNGIIIENGEVVKFSFHMGTLNYFGALIFSFFFSIYIFFLSVFHFCHHHWLLFQKQIYIPKVLIFFSTTWTDFIYLVFSFSLFLSLYFHPIFISNTRRNRQKPLFQNTGVETSDVVNNDNNTNNIL